MKKILSIFVSVFISAAFFIFLFAGIVFFPGTAAAYRDVAQDNPYFQAVQEFEDRKIVKHKLFFPEKTVKRGEFIEWILDISGFEKGDYQAASYKKFEDVPARLRPYVSYLADSGFYDRDDSKKLLPESTITVREMLEMTFFIKGIPASKIFPKDNWPFLFVRPTVKDAHLFYKAYELGMLKADWKFFPWSRLNRAQTAHLLVQSESSGTGATLVITVGGPSSGGEITKNPKFPLLEDAFDRITESYLHKENINKVDLLYGAISGLVEQIDDPYTEFTKPLEENVSDTLSGEIEGIGAYIDRDELDHIRIVAPIRDSPAKAAGLLANDIILEVDGVSVAGFTATKAAAKIRGKPGTAVVLTIQRNGRKFTVEIIRARVPIPNVILEFTEDNIAVMTITTFGNNVLREFISAMNDTVARDARGIVLDLRDNPGGLLDAATSIASYFIERGELIARVRYPDHEQKQIAAGTPTLASYPLRVLVNKGTASASEILAGALQDHGIGKIIGVQTFGKGTVQEFITYTDGSALKITVAEWLTPIGRSIEKTGITPDIEVGRSEADARLERDPQMERALGELRGL